MNDTRIRHVASGSNRDGVRRCKGRDDGASREKWDVELGRQWQEEIDHERALQTADDLVRWGPPEAWPNYELKRARLRNLARSVRELMLGLPADALVLTEHDLTGRGGLLAGRADL